MKALLRTLPVLILIILAMVCIFWIPNLFKSWGLSSKGILYVQLIILGTYLVGYFTSEIASYLFKRSN